MATIIERYQAQNISAQIHRKFGGPLERQCNCLRSQNGTASFVDLFKKPGQDKAYYKGLQTCGSVHSCPLCASKITEYRKTELETLLDKTRDKYHYLITLTIPHYYYQSCSDVRKMFMTARRKFKDWRPLQKDPTFVPYSQLMKHYKYDGSVTTVEVTHGQNGWHIHSHELFIFEKPVTDLEKFRNIIYRSWKKSVEHTKGIEINDLQAFEKRSVRIDELKGDHTNVMTTYLTKIDNDERWGASVEMTKGNLKIADNQNVTPFGMLYKINSETDQDQKKILWNKYAKLFYEYCKAFKGKQFIYFSKNLKRKYGLIELKDEQIVDLDDLVKEFYGFFEPSTEWQEIKQLGLRGWIIQNSDLPWDNMNQKLNNEKILRRALKNEKTKDQKISHSA